MQRFVSCVIQYSKKIWESTRNLGAHPSQLQNSIYSKLCYSSYMVVTSNNFKCCYRCYCFLTHKFKILPTYHIEFFCFSSPTFFFLQIGRNYVSILTTIITNVTVLVLHSVICFGCFMPCIMVSNKKVPPIVSPPPYPLPGFHRVFLQFYKQYLINLFLRSDICKKQFIFKINFSL